MSDTETYYIARVKKPHKKFAVGDIVIGDIYDGQAERLICYGWSSKLNVFIRAYSMRYQGWNDWHDKHGEWHYRTTESGHITIVGEFEASSIELLHEASIKSYAEFMRQLSLFGGNVLEQVEAAATHLRGLAHD
jgi:hypothetical protein